MRDLIRAGELWEFMYNDDWHGFILVTGIDDSAVRHILYMITPKEQSRHCQTSAISAKENIETGYWRKISE